MKTHVLLALALTATAAPLTAQPNRDAALRTFLQTRFAEARRDYGDSTYVVAFADLNGDGREEALVLLQSGYFCGSGGCSLYIYGPAGRHWRTITELTVSHPPVRLLNTRSHGWRDLSVRVRGGGFSRPYDARVRFDGRAYATNPSMAPRVRGRTPGRVLIGPGTTSQRLF